MDADQNEICQFLKSRPNQFVSGKEICRRAGGKWRFRENPAWALPILRRMVECHLLETDDASGFRLSRQFVAAEAKKKKIWLCPAIQRILEESGRNFGVFDLDKDLDPPEMEAITLLPEGQSVPSFSNASKPDEE